MGGWSWAVKGNEIRREDRSKGSHHGDPTGKQRISRRISFARFQRVILASPGSYIIVVRLLDTLPESNGGLGGLDARNLLALIPFMSRSKVNPSYAMGASLWKSRCARLATSRRAFDSLLDHRVLLQGFVDKYRSESGGCLLPEIEDAVGQ